jgi:hypothetical protein
MIRIINGKRYNTETAELVANCGSNGNISRSDFGWHDTDLYLTSNGNWFLAGEGNAASRWASHYGQNGSGPGEGIEPINPADALEELESIGATDIIEKHFPDTIQDA